MRIALDFDGVLRHMDLGLLKLCEETNKWEPFRIHTMVQQPMINPFIFALKDDEIYVISNCKNEDSIKQKKAWLHHFFGDRITFIPIENAVGWKKEFCDRSASLKVHEMIKHNIEVYFDDDPAIIRRMRKITNKIKFLKLGPWIEEYY